MILLLLLVLQRQQRADVGVGGADPGGLDLETSLVVGGS
jgi:hypothetical protein